MSDLGKDALDLLDRARAGEEEAPSAADEARVRAKLAAHLGVAIGTAVLGTTKSAAALGTSALTAGGVKAGLTTSVTGSATGIAAGAGSVGGAGTAGALTGAGFATSLAAKWTVGAVVLGALGGGTAYVAARGDAAAARTSTMPAPTSVLSSPLAGRPSARLDPSAEMPEVLPSAMPSSSAASATSATNAAGVPVAFAALPSAVAPTPPSVTAQPRSEERTAEDPLVVELRLMHEAQRAMAGGDGAEALAKVNEHAQRFPKGSLTPEREGTRVLALCATGRTEEARVAGTRFLNAYGRSPLAERVRHSCAVDAP